MDTKSLLESWDLAHLVPVFEDTFSQDSKVNITLPTTQTKTSLEKCSEEDSQFILPTKVDEQSISQPVHEGHFVDEEDEGENITDADVQKLNFLQFLKSSVEGRAILMAQQKGGKLNDPLRGRLTRRIIQRLLDETIERLGSDLTVNQFVVTKRTFLTYTKAIKRIFPQERRGTYFVGYKKYNGVKCTPRGRLYDAYHYEKRKLRKDGLLMNYNTSLSSQDSEEIDIADTDDPTDLQWLRENSEPEEEIKNYWSKTFNIRRKTLISGQSVNEYLNSFPCLQSDNGYNLLLEDFSRLYPNKENNLFQSWPHIKKRIINLLKTSRKPRNQADQPLVSVLEFLDNEKQDSVIFELLPTMIRPAFITIYDESESVEPAKKKKRLTKRRATIQESREAFCRYSSSLADIDAIIDRKENVFWGQGLKLQPIAILIGTPENVVDAYVVIGNMKYRVNNALSAIDLVFKLCHITDCKYPEPALNSWLFLQYAAYDITIKSDILSIGLQSVIGEVKTSTSTE